MQQYLDLMRRVRRDGVRKTDRTGTGTLSVFGQQMRLDLAAGFPLVTTNRVHGTSIINAMIGSLSGDTTLDYLHAHRVRIWGEWARKSPRSSQIVDDPDIGFRENYGALAIAEPTCLDLGPIYGRQWRSWAAPDGRVIDQIQTAVDTL